MGWLKLSFDDLVSLVCAIHCDDCFQARRANHHFDNLRFRPNFVLQSFQVLFHCEGVELRVDRRARSDCFRRLAT